MFGLGRGPASNLGTDNVEEEGWTMKLMLEQRNVVRAILNRPGDSFVALASVAGLDPETAFREADLRGVDFGIDDLSGFDFTGADLRGANFARARGKDCAV